MSSTRSKIARRPRRVASDTVRAPSETTRAPERAVPATARSPTFTRERETSSECPSPEPSGWGSPSVGRSGGTVPADQVAAAIGHELAAVVNKEALGARELVGLLRQHP